MENMTAERILDRLDRDHIMAMANIARNRLEEHGVARVELTPNDGTRYEIVVTDAPLESRAFTKEFGGAYVVSLVNCDGRSYYWNGTPMHVEYVTVKWAGDGRLWTGVVLTEFLNQLSGFLREEQS